MSAEYYKGPWRLNAGDETQIMDSAQRTVARAQCGGLSGITLTEAEANAHLIAAAPDLLEEGEALLDLLVQLRPDMAESTIAANMRAAIARAKGETA